MDDLIEKMDYYLSEYNVISKSPMNLVMFKFAIEHVSRVSRVLMQPNGNLLLVGIGGSGRHSSAKLAGFMAECSIYEVSTETTWSAPLPHSYLFGFIFQIEISRNYGISDWREDLKKLLLKAGIEGKPIIFLFADTQISDEMFIEDINTVLNTGDVPNLYVPEEKVEILEKMQTAARDSVRVTVFILYFFIVCSKRIICGLSDNFSELLLLININI